MTDGPNNALPPGVQQVTIRIPGDALPAWVLLDGAQHTLVGVVNLLQFMGKPELAGFVAGHAEAIAQKRNEILERANSRVHLAGPGDLTKG